jgi:hypothetical protein
MGDAPGNNQVQLVTLEVRVNQGKVGQQNHKQWEQFKADVKQLLQKKYRGVVSGRIKEIAYRNRSTRGDVS